MSSPRSINTKPRMNIGSTPTKTTSRTTGHAKTAEAKILVLNRGALGDVLLSLPFLAAVPGHFKARSLSVVGNKTILDLLADQPFVDSVQDQNQADWAGLYLDPPQVSARLADYVRTYRAGVVLAGDQSDPAAAGLRRLGLEPVLIVPSRPPQGRAVHLTDHMFAVTGIKPVRGQVLLRPGEESLAKARSLLKAKGLENRPWLALHPGSGARKKNWPVDNWLDLAREIEDEMGLACLFILGPAETELADVIFQGKDGFKPRLIGDMTLPILAALLSLGQGYAGHDSGVTHLAARLGRPTVAVFGPTDPALWSPRGPRVSVLAPRSRLDQANPWEGLTMRRVTTTINSTLKIKKSARAGLGDR